MLKAVILDFDGVIVDTESVWYNIYKDWLREKYDYDLKIQDYLVCVGSNNLALFEFLKREIGEEIDFYHFKQVATDEFIKKTDNLPLMDGVDIFIKEMKQKGIHIGLATSATMTKPKFHLKRLGLFELFDVFSTAELFEKIKPAPDSFLKAAELLQIKPEECLAVEDSENGLQSAQNAEMPCLIVPNEVTKYSSFTGYFKIFGSLGQVDVEELIYDFNCEYGKYNSNF